MDIRLYRLAAQGQRIPRFPGQPHRLRSERMRHIIRILAGHTGAGIMHRQHDIHSFRLALAEDTDKYLDHKFHRREIVVMQDYLIFSRRVVSCVMPVLES